MDRLEQPAKPPHFLAPVFASVNAPLVRAIRRAVVNAMPAAELIEVSCPRLGCGGLCAVWSPLTRQLYDPRTGDPLGTRRQRVEVRCNRCGKTRNTAGLGVGRRLHNGLPPLA